MPPGRFFHAQLEEKHEALLRANDELKRQVRPLVIASTHSLRHSRALPSISDTATQRQTAPRQSTGGALLRLEPFLPWLLRDQLRATPVRPHAGEGAAWAE